MAGWIAISKSKEWSATGWLFRWVMRSLISRAVDPVLRRKLTEIVDANLGALNLDQLSDSEHEEVSRQICESLMDDARAQLKGVGDDPGEVLAAVEELVVMACEDRSARGLR